MAKLTLIASPTFSAKVGIPVAGCEPADVVFTFKHRSKADLDEFVASRQGASEVDSVMAMAQGWDLVAEFNAENVALLIQNYIGAPVVIFRAYLDELLKTKAKN